MRNFSSVRLQILIPLIILKKYFFKDQNTKIIYLLQIDYSQPSPSQCCQVADLYSLPVKLTQTVSSQQMDLQPHPQASHRKTDWT